MNITGSLLGKTSATCRRNKHNRHNRSRNAADLKNTISSDRMRSRVRRGPTSSEQHRRDLKVKTNIYFSPKVIMRRGCVFFFRDDRHVQK